MELRDSELSSSEEKWSELPISNNVSQQNNNADLITLKIITLESTFNILSKKTTTVDQVKRQVAEHLQLSPDKTIRLISRGSILESGSTLDSFNISHNASIHCSISNNPGRHQTVVQMEDNQEELRGFSRLREWGVTDTEIDQLRLQFHTAQLANNGFLHNNLDTNHLMNLEEEWINSSVDSNAGFEEQNMSMSTHHRSSFNQFQEESEFGTYEDLVKGMAMGLILGLIMLLFLPDESLSIRTKYGIVAGVGISVGFGLLRLSMF